MKHKVNNSGFTLIELLIVIVIIGILAGVVLGVLNPVQQQNRARDAAVRSSLSKMALAGKSLYASSPRSTNRTPTINEFWLGIGEKTAAGTYSANCTSAANANSPTYVGTCTFNVTGVTSNQQFAYFRNATAFRIGVLSNATPTNYFVFEYEETAGTTAEGFFACAPNASGNLTYSLTQLNTGTSPRTITECQRL